MASDKRQGTVKEFLQEAGDAIKGLGQKLLQVKISLREDLRITGEDLRELIEAAEVIAAAASSKGMNKTLRLSRQLAAFFTCLKEKQPHFDAKTSVLASVAFEALRALVKDLQGKGKELVDVTEAEESIKDFLRSQGVAAEAPEGKPSLKGPSPGVEIDEKYLDIFLEDTEQNIEHFNQDLVSLEKKPADPELINNLFRVIHTIKGSSGMVHVANVHEVAHAMESILALAREKKAAFSDMFPLLFSGIDTIGGLVLSLRSKEVSRADIAPLVERLKTYAREHSSQEKTDRRVSAPLDSGGDIMGRAVVSRDARELLARAIAQKNDVYRIAVFLEENVPLKSMKALLIEERLKSKGTVILMHPAPDDIDELHRGPVTIGILFSTVVKAQEITSLLSVSEVKVTGVEPLKTGVIRELLEKHPDFVALQQGREKTPQKKEPSSQPQGVLSQTVSIRIDAHKLDTLMNLSGELVTVRAQFERLVNLLHGEILSHREFLRTLGAVKSNFTVLRRDLFPILEKREGLEGNRILRQLDFLNTRLEEVAQGTEQSNLGNEIHLIDETTGMLGKIASYIQAAVMQARMVPIKGVFSRFNRIVRDIAKDLGKDVALILEGEETDLDKNLVDALGEPLIHLVRNAIDHGLEDGPTRKKAGKPERGTVALKAFHEGNNVCVQISDDGRGVDGDMLVYTALKKKLIGEEQAGRLSEREKLDLMFLPGFSTAARVTGLSGRGVGMDAVRSMITSLNGAIDIKSQVGQGTTFILKIPLTLAIIQALLVAIDGETYAVPLEAVTEIIKVTGEMIQPVDGNATVRLREEVLSLIELRDVILTRGTRRPEDGIKRVVVISDGESEVGIFVDRMIGETEIVIKALSHHFFHVKGISGVTILGDGQVALILDPKLIIMASR
ncbi:MAG: chemotaxis protein CheW [Candidatus Omnitrophica bacterium]|nr:chemotaxis protein CheW [Candidatus Omnitrophota bacterium]